MENHPPSWAERFLRWYCNEDFIEEIEGDLYELYDRHLIRHGKPKANMLFGLGVFRFFRPSNIKYYQSSRNNSTSMFRSYIKTGFRSLKKNPTISLINILGLALAIGWATTTYVFIDMMTSMDGYHSNGANIYQVVNHVKSDEGTKKWGNSPILLGAAALDDIPEMERMFRMEYQYGSVKFGDRVFQESLLFTDPAFFTSLDFEFLIGDKNVLFTKGNVVISYDMAVKYFHLQDPVGKEITVKFTNGTVKSFTVAGVLEKYPYNTTIDNDFLFSIEDFFDLNFQPNYDWTYFTDATFVVLRPGTSPYLVTEKLTKYISIQNEQERNWKIDRFELIPLNDLAVQGYAIEGSVSGGNHPAGNIALSIVALMLVLMACFNYMNISLSVAIRRLKEIAYRKVVGGQRKHIIYQFLTENYLQVFFALILGILLCIVLFLPIFNSIIPISIPFEFSSLPSMIGYFVGVLLVVGLISSVYPSIYISRFNPVEIFKGKERFGKNNIFSKVLTGFQLMLAFVTVVSCFLFTDNAIYMMNKKWGYDAQGILVVNSMDQTQVKELKKFAASHPYVSEISGAENHVGYSAPVTSIRQLEMDVRTVVFHVGQAYPEQFAIDLYEGSYFTSNLNEDRQREMLVNKSFVEKMQWDTAIGQQVELDSTNYYVVGVTEDFEYHQWFGYTDMMPVALVVAPEVSYQRMTLKTTPDNMERLQSDLKSAWLGFAPNDPLDMIIQANIFDRFYKENKSNIVIMMMISGLAIVIACLGLFGIVSLNIQRKLKEISIRKVLGAPSKEIIRASSKEFAVLILIALIIGAPVGYYLSKSFLEGIYPDPKPMSWVPFVISVLVVVFTIVITLSGQIGKALRINPIRNLRTE